MTAYAIDFATAAKKQLRKLDPKTRVRILDALDDLAADPRGQQPQAKRLRGDEPGDYRLRVGNYRIVYDLYDSFLLVWVVEVGHRREIYR